MAFELAAFVTGPGSEDLFLTLNVKTSDTIADVKHQVSLQTGAPVAQLQVMFNNAPMPDTATLAACNISSMDMVQVQYQPQAQHQQQQHQQQRQQQHHGAGAPPGLLPVNLLPPNLFGPMPTATADPNAFSLLPPTLAAAVPAPPVETADSIIARLRADPAEFTRLMERNPSLATAILEDPERAKRVIDGYLAERQRRQAEIDALHEQLRRDPFNVEAQRKIEDAIRLQNVEENMNFAMEHTPEVFAQVSMLYIDCEVNNTPVKAFVDSGAQMTIMSQQCAERCGISRLIDVRSAGVARGVGTSKIIGRIHSTMIRIGDSRFACSITVLESIDIDFLLGLDMLRKHQCCIDLENNVLRIGGETTPFLSEKDIPKSDHHDDDPLHRLGSSGSLGSSRG